MPFEFLIALFRNVHSERIADPANRNRVGKPVKTHQGAPGVDRRPIEAFPPGIRSHWEAIRQARLDGTYQPQPVRRVSIPKPNGGERRLGISTVRDRLIPLAIAN
jgi:RNA-directed DNA polymerase